MSRRRASPTAVSLDAWWEGRLREHTGRIRAGPEQVAVVGPGSRRERVAAAGELDLEFGAGGVVRASME